MVWMVGFLFCFTCFALLLVICLQVRQHNELLGHLKDMTDRYQQLALRVRWVQLQTEEGVKPEYTQHLEEELFGPHEDLDSTTEIVTGKM